MSAKQLAAVTKHGMRSTRIYMVWVSMKGRCLRPTHLAWKAYGGRGIKVCDRWMLFENFLADMGAPPVGMELDRINNDGNYEPGNCRWATVKQQSRNRRSSVLLTFNGETKCASEWAEIKGVKPGLILRRLKAGWSVEETLTLPVATRQECRGRFSIRNSNIRPQL